MFKNLAGYRTYICVAIAGTAYLAGHYGYISTDTASLIEAAFGFGSVAALRAAVVNAVMEAAAMCPPIPATMTDSSADKG